MFLSCIFHAAASDSLTLHHEGIQTFIWSKNKNNNNKVYLKKKVFNITAKLQEG